MVISQDSVVLKQVANSKRMDRVSLAASAVQKNSEKILDSNKAQMRMGLDSGGNFFYPYTPNYLSFKQMLSTYKAPIGVPDLYLSGTFQREMDMEIDSDWYAIVSYAPYAQHIINRYPRAFGLSERFMKPVVNLVTKDYNYLVHVNLNK